MTSPLHQMKVEYLESLSHPLRMLIATGGLRSEVLDPRRAPAIADAVQDALHRDPHTCPVEGLTYG